MRALTIFAICTICTFLAACAPHRAPAGYSLNASIDPDEIKGQIHLKQCDPRSPTWKCGVITFVCKQRGCGQLEVEHASQPAPATSR